MLEWPPMRRAEWHRTASDLTIARGLELGCGVDYPSG